MKNSKLILVKFKAVFLIISFLGLCIFGKICFLQIIEGKKWRSVSQNLTLEYRPIKANRGNIYSSNNLLLSISLPYYKLAIDPCIIDEKTFAKEVTPLSRLISNFFKDKPPITYERLLKESRKNKKRYLVLNTKKFDYNQKKLMMSWPIFNKGQYKGGVIFEKEEIRYQPFKSLAARSIGYVNANQNGSGLEYTYNKILKGKNGKALFQKVSGGWKMLQNSTQLEPIHGYDIVTTIDSKIQDIANDAVKSALEESDADYGCAAIMEVATGEIKAIVNLTKMNTGKYEEAYNYIIGYSRDPGSTFKIASIIALFEETDLNLDDIVETGNGKYKFFDKTMSDYKIGGFGTITIKKAIAVSSMIGIAKLIQNAFAHNPQKYIDYLNKMGFTSKLGFQIVGEAEPIVKTPMQKDWSGVTLPWMSSGYEIEITPLQLLTFYNAIANDGKMVKPFLLKKILSANKVIKQFNPETLNRKICSDASLQKVKILLEEVVENGSAKKIKKGIYQISGKSGTAKRIEKGKYIKSYYVSFAGYFPRDNPKYSCVVAVNNPKKNKQYGSDMAAPIVRQIADRIAINDIKEQLRYSNNKFKEYFGKKTFPKIKFGYKNDLAYLLRSLKINFYIESCPKVKSSQKNLYIQSNNLDKVARYPCLQNDTYFKNIYRTKLENDELKLVSVNASNKFVPNLIGFTLKDGIFLLEQFKLRVKISGKGNRIKQQSISQGTKIMENDVIEIVA